MVNLFDSNMLLFDIGKVGNERYILDGIEEDPEMGFYKVHELSFTDKQRRLLEVVILVRFIRRRLNPLREE